VVFRLVKGQIEFVAVESPRDEDKVTSLRVEREVSDVERAVGIDDGRKHPEHLPV